jgi:hypothetical protein
MQREPNRFVIGRDNNVVRVDFGRDPDPPAPTFPGANGLREVRDVDIGVVAVALSADSANGKCLIR